MAERTNNRSDLRIEKDVNGKMVLFVKECQTKARNKEVALLSCLAEKMGRVVSYEALCRSLGFTSAPKSKRLLRQHVTNLRKILSEHRANSAVVVAVGFGYGLSEMARD